ncbi:hypothetical protein [Polyangium sp. y55x31]|uniref:hypothetical protein n=1 Tax=Polyangium sp. y55x31 TaxID=3042688 RepID=UPI0024821BFE|nr:hypothetical protein [Polyangium sp. y55x31]MDI1475962.1 hypothetical protein [Polyangium sp. y55x31]
MGSSKPDLRSRRAELLGLQLDVRRIVRSDKARTRDSADDKEQQVIANALGDLPNYTPHPDGMKPCIMEPPTQKKQTHTPHTPRRPLVDSDKQGRPTSGLSADSKGSSADTSH